METASNSALKIAVLTSSYPRYPGDGTAPFIKSICEQLVKQGHQVEVAAPYDPAVQPQELHGVRLQRFHYIWPVQLHVMGHARSLDADVRLRPLAYLLLPLYLLAAALSLYRLARRENAQVIHVHWVVPNGLAAALVAAWLRLPLVVSLHGSDVFLARSNRLYGAAARMVFRRAAGVTACSPEFGQVAVQLGARPEDLLVVPYGIDPDQFQPKPVENQAAPQAKPEVGRLVIAALGRMVYKKGFEHLVAAMPAVLERLPQAQLVLGGEGPLLDALRRQVDALGITERVTFAGRVPWDRVPAFFHDADICVVPSVRDRRGNLDGLPNVVLEAMACGLPVVASDLSGVPLVIEHGRNGLLTPPGDEQALAQALISLGGDAGLRARLGQAARRSVEVEFNWEQVVSRMAEVIARAVEISRRNSGPPEKAQASSSSSSSNSSHPSTPSIPSSDYTRDYFLTSCQGHAEFIASRGQALPPRLSMPLELAQVQPGMQVVDIGCGRGEIALQSAWRGAHVWGLDYAREALALAGEALDAAAEGETRRMIGLQRANAQHLPLASDSADVVFMLDVVEHLYPRELQAALDEAWRVLKLGGRLVAHTMPNLWYYRWGYPLYRRLQRIRGHSLPPDPRQRWAYSHVHVNEQTPPRLAQALRASGFQTHVWLASTVDYGYEPNRLVRWGMGFLTRAWPLRYIFCNDIFAIGLKTDSDSRARSPLAEVNS